MSDEEWKASRKVSREDHSDWEDVDESDKDANPRVEYREQIETASTFRTVASPRSTPRKRRHASRVQMASPNMRRITSLSNVSGRAKQTFGTVAAPPQQQQQQPRKPARPLVTEDELRDAFTDWTRASARYVHDITIVVFKLLKTPIALLAVVWLLIIVLNAVSERISRTFAPVCRLPGFSRMDICTIDTRPVDKVNKTLNHADYPAIIEIQSKTFDQLLDESVSSTGLALEIKKAQLATSDLVTLVKVSKLVSKDALATVLTDFVDDARKSGRDLQRFGAKISGTLDDILAINDYALHVIEAAAAKRSNSLTHYLWPFNNQALTSTSPELLATFSQSYAVLSSSLSRLILSAQSILHSLDKLESQLSTIHDILTREDATITTQHSELLAELWTRLGGNRAQLRGFEGNLQLLKELGMYRNKALAHVVSALQTLESLQADMEELRDRVATPEIAGEGIPLEVHVKSIRSGIERLSQRRLEVRDKEAGVQRALGIDSA